MRLVTASALVISILTACAGPPGAGPAPTTTVTPTMAPPTTAGTTTAPSTTTEPGGSLPPHTGEALIDLLSPLAGPLGFRVTRAALVDLTTYGASPDGGHLAVYVAPLEDLSAAEHAEAFVPLAGAFLPYVFEQWPGLESFDICQEPHLWPHATTPQAVTIIDVDRATAASIDWATVDLAGIIALARDEPRLTVTANLEVAASQPWSDAAGE